MSREDSPPLLLFGAAFLLVALSAAVPAALAHHTREARASAEPRAPALLEPDAGSRPAPAEPPPAAASSTTAAMATASAIPTASAMPTASAIPAPSASAAEREPASSASATASASASARPASAEADGPGFLTISSVPPSRVSEHGRVLCTSTPCAKLPLPAGAHTITLENKEESLKNSIAVTITSGETTSRRVTLKP